MGEFDLTNDKQAIAWDGDAGAYWAANAAQLDRSLAGYTARFLAAAAIEPTDRVLDIGCGTGQTTRAAAEAAFEGSALGVDLSLRMIEHARELANARGMANAEFEQGDVQIHPFLSASIDVAISRTGCMFFGRPDVAYANIARALRPGGRMALLVWQSVDRNEWFSELMTALNGRPLTPPPDEPGPFAFADPNRVTAILSAAGFVDVDFEDVRASNHFGDDAATAETFVLGLLDWLIRDLDDAGRERARERLRTTLAAHSTSEGVMFGSAAWLITCRKAEARST